MEKKLNLSELMSGKNVNFLIGSGASVPMFRTLSLGEECRSLEDLISDDNLEPGVRNFLYVMYYLLWIRPMVETEQYMGSDDTTSNYTNFVKLLINFLEHESNERPKRINLFTTNYDLNFEHTFDRIAKESNVYFNDGGAGFINRTLSTKNYNITMQHSGVMDNYRREVPCINLLKMHGSVSWKSENNNVLIDYSDNYRNKWLNCFVKKEEHDKLIDAFLKKLIQFCSAYKKRDLLPSEEELLNEIRGIVQNIDHEALKRFVTLIRSLPIINPDQWKFRDTVLEQHYYQTIRSFSYEMEKKNSILIVFGFSFADEHILEIFLRSLSNPTLQVIIVCYSKGTKESLKKIIGEHRNIKYLPNNFDLITGDFRYLNYMLGGHND